MIYSFKGFIPVIHPSSFVHPMATVTGNVIIGKHVYIGPGAALRGDWGAVVIDDGCNVQENCTLHMFPGKTIHLMQNSHIGHGAIIHGASIGRDCMVGMNAVIMDNVHLGDGSIVGALTFVPEGMEVCYAYQEVDALPEGYNVPEGRVKPWGTAHAVLCAKPFRHLPHFQEQCLFRQPVVA